MAIDLQTIVTKLGGTWPIPVFAVGDSVTKGGLKGEVTAVKRHALFVKLADGSSARWSAAFTAKAPRVAPVPEPAPKPVPAPMPAPSAKLPVATSATGLPRSDVSKGS